MSLPVLPGPTAAPLPVLLDSLRDFVKLALDSDDLPELTARYDQAHAIADYLGRKDHAKEGQAALRILEVRIGELLGPAERTPGPGRGKPSVTTDGLSRDRKQLHHMRRKLERGSHPTKGFAIPLVTLFAWLKEHQQNVRRGVA